MKEKTIGTKYEAIGYMNGTHESSAPQAKKIGIPFGKPIFNRTHESSVPQAKQNRDPTGPHGTGPPILVRGQGQVNRRNDIEDPFSKAV